VFTNCFETSLAERNEEGGSLRNLGEDEVSIYNKPDESISTKWWSDEVEIGRGACACAFDSSKTKNGIIKTRTLIA
jgi:hypothetical protein